VVAVAVNADNLYRMVVYYGDPVVIKYSPDVDLNELSEWWSWLKTSLPLGGVVSLRIERRTPAELGWQVWIEVDLTIS
jgi:hypothetical protein